jgi:hypothetical protein
MMKNNVNQAVGSIRPCNVLVSDGSRIYVDDPETVLLRSEILIIGKHPPDRVMKELAMVALAHITGIGPGQPRPLRNVA